MERKYKAGKGGKELENKGQEIIKQGYFVIHWEIQCRFLGHSGETLLKVGGERGREGKVKRGIKQDYPNLNNSGEMGRGMGSSILRYGLQGGQLGSGGSTGMEHREGHSDGDIDQDDRDEYG